MRELTPVEKLTKYTKINIQDYLDRFVFFVDSDYYTAIYSYYSGVTQEPNAEAFGFLSQLENICNSILFKSKTYLKLLNRVGDIDLLLQIEESKIKLKTVRNLSFFLRTNVGRQNGFTSNYILAKNETLQDVSENILEDIQPVNDWLKIALQNRINEISYRTDGGFVVKLVANTNLINGSVQSVLGAQIGSEALGKDIDRKIKIENDDLKILSNKETFLQSVDIYINLQKGDAPQYQDYGITAEAVVGQNINSLNFPIVLRELSDILTQDDTIQSFQFGEIEVVSDYFLAKLNVTAITGQTETFTLSLS